MIVVDASAVVDFLVGADERADWVRQTLADEDDPFQAPALVDYEVASALRRHAVMGGMSEARGAQALEDLQLMRLTRHSPRPFVSRIWALRHTVSAYDASYIALAEELGCALVTTDGRLARSHGHDAIVRSP